MLVQPNTAKLAKEKGFNEICKAVYDSNGKLTEGISDFWNCKRLYPNHEWYAAPEHHVLQQWLMDNHKIRVFPKQGASGNFNFEIYKWNYDNNLGIWERIGNVSSYESYSVAFDIGLFTGLKLIK